MVCYLHEPLTYDRLICFWLQIMDHISHISFLHESMKYVASVTNVTFKLYFSFQELWIPMRSDIVVFWKCSEHHIGRLHLNGFFPSWTVAMCWFRPAFCSTLFLHNNFLHEEKVQKIRKCCVCNITYDLPVFNQWIACCRNCYYI